MARSSTEAEYRAMAMTTANLYWIRMLLKDLHVLLVSPHTLWCDNVGALALASNLVFHAKTKYIEVDYHFIHENVVNKDMVICFISIDDQVVDIFTKGLSTPRFSVLRSKLLVTPCPICLQGDVKESISIHDSADLVGKTANSFPNIIPTAIVETKSTSTFVMESLNRGNQSK